MTIIQKIKASVKLKDYIEKVTGETIRNLGTWSGLQECPFCSSNSGFRITPDEERFLCFSCWATGDVVDFRGLMDKTDFKQTVQTFAKELGIKQANGKDLEWIAIRETACEYMREQLFTCQTQYNFRGQYISPLHYLTDVRKHSYEAILNFRLGFNDGSLEEHLKKSYPVDIIKASGLNIIPAECFVYPFVVEGELAYFRIKDPNKINMVQMPKVVRSKNALWFNQDSIKEDKELILVEGEDDVLSLWDCGVDAAGTCGMLTGQQIEYVKGKNPNPIFLAFDGDSAGKRDVEMFVRSAKEMNALIVNIPDDKDVDDLIRDTENKEELIENLKKNVSPPDIKLKSIINQTEKGYYIIKGDGEKKLTNWTIAIKAVIVRSESERLRKVTIRTEGQEADALMPSEAFSSVMRLKEFLSSVSNKICYFLGSDQDFSYLHEYWSITSSPKIVFETECVGEIEQGFIAENVFVSNIGEVRPLTNGFLSIDDSNSIKIPEIVARGKAKSQLPYFNLVEPSGGIQEYTKLVYSLMVKNRNLKVALGIGWIKACLWSTQFFAIKRFFPILSIYGKYQGGKSSLGNWLRSFVGMRDVNPEPLSNEGTTEPALARKFAYYSSLPVFVDEYGNSDRGHAFHTFFNSCYDRSSSSKALRDTSLGVKMHIVRGCLMLVGEDCPDKASLLSRCISLEITPAERNSRYYKEIIQLEPQFNCIGLNWLKRRHIDFERFLKLYETIEQSFAKALELPRQAAVMAVPVAAILTEDELFDMDELMEFAILIAKKEIEERKTEEIVVTLWEALDVLRKQGKLDKQIISYDYSDMVSGAEIQIHLPSLIAKISGEAGTRHYAFKLPNSRNLTHLLKQEPYFKILKNVQVDNQQGWRVCLDLASSPEILKDSSTFGSKRGSDDL